MLINSHTVLVLGKLPPQIWANFTKSGVTDSAGPAAGVIAQIGFGGDPSTTAVSFWDATFRGDSGTYDQYSWTLTNPVAGSTITYFFRVSLDGGATFQYCDFDGLPFTYSSTTFGKIIS